MLRKWIDIRQVTDGSSSTQKNLGIVDPSDPKSWLSPAPLILLDEMPLEIQGYPLSQCSTTELKTVRQLMQHYRNMHTARSKKGLPSMYDEESFDAYLGRHGNWRCGKHNALYATLSAKTERKDGLHRPKYNSCRNCGHFATPTYKLPLNSSSRTLPPAHWLLRSWLSLLLKKTELSAALSLLLQPSHHRLASYPCLRI